MSDFDEPESSNPADQEEAGGEGSAPSDSPEIPADLAAAPQEERPVGAPATSEDSAGELATGTSFERVSNEQSQEVAAEASDPAVDRRKTPRGARPSLSEEREPVFHEAEGYRLRMDPPDLARLRELPGAKGKTDRELGEQFFSGQSPRLVASIAGDVETPAEIRVVVDPYSRQAFLAVGRTIRGIVSF